MKIRINKWNIKEVVQIHECGMRSLSSFNSEFFIFNKRKFFNAVLKYEIEFVELYD